MVAETDNNGVYQVHGRWWWTVHESLWGPGGGLVELIRRRRGTEAVKSEPGVAVLSRKRFGCAVLKNQHQRLMRVRVGTVLLNDPLVQVIRSFEECALKSLLNCTAGDNRPESDQVEG